MTVLAYQYGAGLCEILTPTNGAMMAILAAAGVRYEVWLRFALPMTALLYALGAVVVLIGSVEGTLGASLGTPFGNGIILISVLLWSSFTLLARRQSQSQHPIELSCYTQITSSLVIPLFLVPDIALHHPLYGSITWLAVISALALAILISVFRDILFQWGLQGTSAFTSSVMGFFAPFLTVAYAIPLLGEQLSVSLLISGALIIVGIFFAVIVPARQQRAQTPAPEPVLVGVAEHDPLR